MSDTIPSATTPTPTNQQAMPGIGVKAQYIKDLSFENPRAPASLQMTERPHIDMRLDIGVQRLPEDHYEVALKIHTTAKSGDNVAFVAEMTYAGVFWLNNVPENARESVLLIYCPHLLFPFARRIMADVTRDGGFLPLMLEPIDFETLFRQRKADMEKAEPMSATAN